MALVAVQRWGVPADIVLMQVAVINVLTRRLVLLVRLELIVLVDIALKIMVPMWAFVLMARLVIRVLVLEHVVKADIAILEPQASVPLV
jgi:hypothetical protein